MDDTKGKPVVVLNKQGQAETDSLGRVVTRQGNTGPITGTEDPAEQYRRQKKGSNTFDEYEAQRLEKEEDSRLKKSGLPAKYAKATPTPTVTPAASPSPTTGNTSPVVPRKPEK
jgi:hypothetical protein